MSNRKQNVLQLQLFWSWPTESFQLLEHLVGAYCALGLGQNIKRHPVWDVKSDFQSFECVDGSLQTSTV